MRYCTAWYGTGGFLYFLANESARSAVESAAYTARTDARAWHNAVCSTPEFAWRLQQLVDGACYDARSAQCAVLVLHVALCAAL